MRHERVEEEFQCRMITEENIDGLLMCRWHRMNGRSCLIYDITSLQSLSSIYAERKMHREEFMNFLYALKEIKKRLEEYLLEVQNIYLAPEFIFEDLDTKKFYFLYYPCLHDYEDDGKMRCMDFLLSSLEPEDEEMIDLFYSSYERNVKSSDFSWVDFLYKEINELKKEEIKEEIRIPEVKDLNLEELYIEKEELWNGEEEVDQGSRLKKVIIILTFYIIIVGIVSFYLFANYILSVQEKGIVIGTTGAFTGIIALVVYRYLKQGEEKANSQPEKNDEIVDLGRNDNSIRENPNHILEQYKNQEEVDGHTKYFEMETGENKLYGIGKDNRNIFSLDHLPFTIGRKEGAVDGLLKDDSISRMHVRFYQENEVLYMEDLNSTNGTYKNGILLSPHEKVEVYLEDEIRFGKLGFVYR